MEYIKVLLPSICVGLIFWYVIRAVVRSDSIERREMDRYYAELGESGDAGEDTAGAAEDSAAEQENVNGTRDEDGAHRRS